MDKLQASRIVGGNGVHKRSASDFYPTPPEATQALLNAISIPENMIVWEPACGDNHMVDVIRRSGHAVIGTDIKTGANFLTTDMPEGVGMIITNPPFSLAEEFIKRADEFGVPFAFLLKSQFWHAKRRYQLFCDIQPSAIFPLTWRPDFMFGACGSGRPLMDVVWCTWLPAKHRNGVTVYRPLEKPGESVVAV